MPACLQMLINIQAFVGIRGNPIFLVPGTSGGAGRALEAQIPNSGHGNPGLYLANILKSALLSQPKVQLVLGVWRGSGGNGITLFVQLQPL